MKLSINWIRDFVDLPEDLEMTQLAYDLTMCTVEVEEVLDLGAAFADMVVGKVLSVNPHPNADKLRLVSTDIGESEAVPIVCGGSNLKPGMFVAVASPGAKVRWHGEDSLTTLKSTKIRGERSEGMICSSVEIGLAELFPAADEKEIIDLSGVAEELQLKAGMPLAKGLGFDDVLLDIDNKSLTNRPDLWGHYGMARELAAIYGRPLRALTEPVVLPESDQRSLSIRIENDRHCYRYIGVDIDNVRPMESPFWLRRRLSLLDQRSINFLVDLTNYVMLTVGQPLHVFDYGRIGEHEIIVRSATDGEKIELLDAEQYELTEADLVIADKNVPVALAGVMGGNASSVNDQTTRIILESASFEPTGVRRTATRHGLRSESSMRFEKGIDAERVKEGVDLFVNLLKDAQPEAAFLSASDSYPVIPAVIEIEVSQSFINSRIGKELSVKEIGEKLRLLQFGVEEKDGVFHLTVPSWRATGDVSIPEDIVEEVARLFGYDNIEFVPPQVVLTEAVMQRDIEIVRGVQEYLARQGGMNEVFTYPWVEDDLLQATGYSPDQCCRLFAAPSPSTASLRPSLIPGLVHAAKQNRRHYQSCAVFEEGRVFLLETDENGAPDQEDALPRQPKMIGGAFMCGDAREAYLSAKGVLEGLFPALRLDRPIWKRVEDGVLRWAARGSVFELVGPQERHIGYLGLLAGGAALRAGLKRAEVALFELDTEAVARLNNHPIVHEALPQFPEVEYDLAILVSEDVEWGAIEDAAATSHPFVKHIQFLDEYRGAQVPRGKKSVALRSIIGNPEATLSSEEVNTVGEALFKSLHSRTGAEMRSN